jgi:hypothetical protein
MAGDLEIDGLSFELAKPTFVAQAGSAGSASGSAIVLLSSSLRST